MFRKAIEMMKPFTRPLITVRRQIDGSLSAGVSAFLIVNDAGWIVTCAHAVEDLRRFDSDKKIVAEFKDAHERIVKNTSLNAKQRKRQLRAATPPPETLTHCVLIWGTKGWNVSDLTWKAISDVAVGRIDNFAPAWITDYPIFRDPQTAPAQGTSLCRLGYPFAHVGVSFDDTKDHFSVEIESLPMFPIEGILTRIKNLVGDDGYEAEFLETSSPGLKGQSGGPLFDVNGVVWGMQSHTDHLPLGFSPKLKVGKTTQVEHQYLNVGQAVSSGELLRCMDEKGVKYHVG